MTTATAFTISHTTEQEILAELEVDFETFRSRIAHLSVEACSTLTGMFSPLGPVEDEVIDLKVIEDLDFDFDLAISSIEQADAMIFDFAAAAA